MDLQLVYNNRQHTKCKLSSDYRNLSCYELEGYVQH